MSLAAHLNSPSLLALWLLALAGVAHAQDGAAAAPALNALDAADAAHESKLARLRLQESAVPLTPLDTKCLTSKTDEHCSDHMKSVKETLVSALQTGCASCDAAQRAAASAVAATLVFQHPRAWKLLVLRHGRANASQKHCTRHERLSLNATKIDETLSPLQGNTTDKRAERRLKPPGAMALSNSSVAPPCKMCREQAKSKHVKKFQPRARQLKKRFHNNIKKDFVFWVY